MLARFRPKAKNENGSKCVRCLPDKLTAQFLSAESFNSQFTFDRVLDEQSGQAEVYDEVRARARCRLPVCCFGDGQGVAAAGS